MVHMSDIAWGVSGEEALNLHHKGETVSAQVLDVDVEKERISLGMKQLERGGVARARATRRRRRRRRRQKNEVVTVTVCRCATAASTSRSATTGDRLHQARAISAATATSSARAFPGRAEVRCDGDRLRSFEEAELLGKAMQIAEGEAGGGQYGSADSGASLGDILGEAAEAEEQLSSTGCRGARPLQCV
jgi:small subunit ribosomal protein S1